MNGTRFDELTRGLAQSRSRRDVLKVLLAAAVGGVFLRPTTSEAACKLTPSCAQWCANVFGGINTPAAKECTEEAGKCQGACYTCGPGAGCSGTCSGQTPCGTASGTTCCASGQTCSSGTCTSAACTSNADCAPGAGCPANATSYFCSRFGFCVCGFSTA